VVSDDRRLSLAALGLGAMASLLQAPDQLEYHGERAEVTITGGQVTFEHGQIFVGDGKAKVCPLGGCQLESVSHR
jgi:hypothetical protein